MALGWIKLMAIIWLVSSIYHFSMEKFTSGKIFAKAEKISLLLTNHFIGIWIY